MPGDQLLVASFRKYKTMQQRLMCLGREPKFLLPDDDLLEEIDQEIAQRSSAAGPALLCPVKEENRPPPLPGRKGSSRFALADIGRGLIPNRKNSEVRPGFIPKMVLVGRQRHLPEMQKPPGTYREWVVALLVHPEDIRDELPDLDPLHFGEASSSSFLQESKTFFKKKIHGLEFLNLVLPALMDAKAVEGTLQPELQAKSIPRHIILFLNEMAIFAGNPT